MDLKRILTRLVRLAPEAPETLPLKRRAERGLLKLLQSDGLRAAERLVADLNAGGHRFEPVVRAAGTRTWTERVADGERTIDIYVASMRSYRATSLRYAEVPKAPKLTPAQRRRDALRQRFYDRYMALGAKSMQRAHSASGIDRRLLLVGELEADVNNGGFSQYLGNKGARRARSALVALKAVGARKTAMMLEQAMAPGVTEAQLSALDSRFYKGSEDLALLAARLITARRGRAGL